tara:strand:+ start:6308 stop:7537 length:1230 start_codon:yes stop_codon:yes gene_type:complete
MSAPFYNKEGNKVLLFYYCPITKQRRKKSWTIKPGLKRETMQMAKNFNKQLATDIATEKYVPNDVKFCFALDKLEEIYRNKYNQNKKDPHTGIRPKTYDEYVGYLNVIRGQSKDNVLIQGRRLTDYMCSEIDPQIADEVSRVFASTLSKHNNTKCWFKFEAACKIAITQGYGLKFNPCDQVDRSLHMSKSRVVKKIAPTKKDVEKLNQHLKFNKDRPTNNWRVKFKRSFDYIYNKFSQQSGLRGCEIRPLLISDINLKKGYVTVTKSHCGKTGNISITKTDASDRIVALSDDMITDLKDWINFMMTNEGVFSNPKWLLFPSLKGQIVNQANVNNRVIKDNAIAAGLDPSLFSPHQYRRYNNSLRRTAGHNKDRIKKQLGHVDDKMSDLYNTTWDDLDKDRDNINEIFNG